METYRISRTHQDALEFDGLLLATATSPQLESERGWRGFELMLYRPACGGFVISIEFLTTCPHERHVLQAEVVDQPKDVENVMLVFEPCEHVDQKALRMLQDEPRHRLQKRLCRLYDEQVTQILDTLSKHHRDHQDVLKSPADKSGQAQKHGILSFLRLN